MELNGVELSWMELNGVEWSWMELNGVELSWMELNGVDQFIWKSENENTFQAPRVLSLKHLTAFDYVWLRLTFFRTGERSPTWHNMTQPCLKMFEVDNSALVCPHQSIGNELQATKFEKVTEWISTVTGALNSRFDVVWRYCMVLQHMATKYETCWQCWLLTNFEACGTSKMLRLREGGRPAWACGRCCRCRRCPTKWWRWVGMVGGLMLVEVVYGCIPSRAVILSHSHLGRLFMVVSPCAG